MAVAHDLFYGVFVVHFAARDSAIVQRFLLKSRIVVVPAVLSGRSIVVADWIRESSYRSCPVCLVVAAYR